MREIEEKWAIARTRKQNSQHCSALHACVMLMLRRQRGRPLASCLHVRKLEFGENKNKLAPCIPHPRSPFIVMGEVTF